MAQEEGRASKPLRFRFRSLWRHLIRGIRKAAGWYNHRMKKVYSPTFAALTGTALAAAISIFLLFGPRFIGVADDGSLTEVMRGAGLGYRVQDLEEPVGAYALRYLVHSGRTDNGVSSHQMLIRAAMWIDDLITHDNLLDLRVLGGLCLLLYLPAVYLVLRGLCSRVRVALEATVLTVLGALVLADGAVVSYFNTLYPEAMWVIFLTYILGICLMMPSLRDGGMQGAFLALTVCGILLTMTETHCAAAGAVLALFCTRQIMMEGRNHRISITAIICAAVLATTSLYSATQGISRFTETSRLHAMTNGVLMRSRDPAETLAEFGIDERFETVTDMSAYSDYPYALSGNPEIQRDFLPRYRTWDVMAFYLRHPFDWIGMMEIGTRAAFRTARSYVGNYEKAAGLEERARNSLFTNYSEFRSGSMPQTLGFLAILGAIYLALFRKKKSQAIQDRKVFRTRQLMLDTFGLMLLIGLAEMTAVICLSGTAELERYAMLYGICIDGMILLFLAEILHRLNILSEE